MTQVFVTFAPETADARRQADEVRAAFEGPDTAVTVTPASQATIRDLAPADLVLFGVGRAETDVPAEYAELARVFAGCNLAGRAAAFFTLGAVRASAGLRRALKPTEISVLDEEAAGVPGGRPEVKEWAAVVREFLRGVRDGRR